MDLGELLPVLRVALDARALPSVEPCSTASAHSANYWYTSFLKLEID